MDEQAVSTSMKTVYIRIYTSVLYTSYIRNPELVRCRSKWISCSNVYADDDAKYGAYLAIDGEIILLGLHGEWLMPECWWNTLLDRPVTLTDFRSLNRVPTDRVIT